MTTPFAKPVPPAPDTYEVLRGPRVFAAEDVTASDGAVESLAAEPVDIGEVAPLPRRAGLSGLFGRIVGISFGLLVSLALGLWVDHLVRELFAAQPWLGWVGLVLAAALGVALIGLLASEYLSLRRLGTLRRLHRQAEKALDGDRPKDGAAVLDEVLALYAATPRLARAREQVLRDRDQIFDGGEYVRLADRLIMAPLDAEARALTAASARRVALVTTVSPRALVDIGFVLYESIRLGGAIARLYGARPGFAGTLRLTGAVLQHLAVTGGLVLSDGVMEQLVGQGLAARLSARLGEGVVNGLMTVRVGIAAMRVVRPLPYATGTPPMVKDFVPELVKVLEPDRKA